MKYIIALALVLFAAPLFAEDEYAAIDGKLAITTLNPTTYTYTIEDIQGLIANEQAKINAIQAEADARKEPYQADLAKYQGWLEIAQELGIYTE